MLFVFVIWLITFFMICGRNKEKSDKNKDGERIVATAAKLIMSEIREKEYDTSVYPKSDEMKISSGNWIPKLLKTFMQVLVKSELKHAISQSIIQAAKPRSALLQIPFGLPFWIEMAYRRIICSWLLQQL